MSDQPQSCIGCVYFNFDAGSQGYSIQTPGTGWECYCNREHYWMDGYSVTLQQYRDNLARGVDCHDFKEYTPPPPPPPPFQLTAQGLVKMINGLALAHVVILGTPHDAADDGGEGQVNVDDFVVAFKELTITKTIKMGTATWTADRVRWLITCDDVTSFQAVAVYDPADLVVVAFQNYPDPRLVRKGDTINMEWGGKDGNELMTVGAT